LGVDQAGAITRKGKIMSWIPIPRNPLGLLKDEGDKSEACTQGPEVNLDTLTALTMAITGAGQLQEAALNLQSAAEKAEAASSEIKQAIPNGKLELLDTINRGKGALKVHAWGFKSELDQCAAQAVTNALREQLGELFDSFLAQLRQGA
jgi:hypothetical protein